MTGRWQPIETAPKDGSPFLAWCPIDWDFGDGDATPDAEMRILWWEQRGQFTSDRDLGNEKFTHWMPLPDPPTPAEGSARQGGVTMADRRTSERGRALILAAAILDRPSGDPDDDLAVLARQLTRAQEEIDASQPSDDIASADRVRAWEEYNSHRPRGDIDRHGAYAAGFDAGFVCAVMRKRHPMTPRDKALEG